MDEYYRAIQSLPSWLSRPLAELPIELAEQFSARRPASRRSGKSC